ncbi:MAG: acyltransferase [Desulfobacterales bacterium]
MNDFKKKWTRFWMRHAGLHPVGRFSTWMAERFAPRYKKAQPLAAMNPLGYIASNVALEHPDIRFGRHVFLDERVVINRMKDGGQVVLDDHAVLLRGCILETGDSGQIHIGYRTYIHPNCQLIAYVSDVIIGSRVMIAPNCAFYPHDHGTRAGIDIIDQSLMSRGPIRIEDNAWLGTGVIVLGGVTIGEGAVVGAGSVVTRDIPPQSIAIGTPAKVVRSRS